MQKIALNLNFIAKQNLTETLHIIIYYIRKKKKILYT